MSSAQIASRKQVAVVERPLAGTGSAPVALRALQEKTVAIAKKPQVQAIVLSLGGGGLALGAAGGACGLASGAAFGSAVGLVPALFTFGLSIPAGAVVGGTIGLVGGTVVGAGSGMLAGGATGGVAYKYRIEIKDGFVHIHTAAGNVCATAKVKAVTMGEDIKVHLLRKAASTKARAISTASYTREKALDLVQKTARTSRELASDRTLQVTTASAAVGGTAMGATGGVVGLATGSIVGAAIGIVPALFTFGLSIPIGAFIGGATGACAGAATGGTIGAVGGGAVGRGAYTKREAIKDGAASALGTAGDYAGYAKGKAQESATYVKVRMTGATGGTDGITRRSTA